MKIDFFTPILNFDKIPGIRLQRAGEFAEKFLAFGNKSYQVLSGQRKPNGTLDLFRIEPSDNRPYLATAGKVVRLILQLTLVIPLLLLAVKALYRLVNRFTLVKSGDGCPGFLKADELLKIKQAQLPSVDPALPMQEKIEFLERKVKTPALRIPEEAKAVEELKALVEMARPEVEVLFSHRFPPLNAQAMNPKERFDRFIGRLSQSLPLLVALTEAKTRKLLEKDAGGRLVAQSDQRSFKAHQRHLRVLFLYLLKQSPHLEENKKRYVNHLNAPEANAEAGGQPYHYIGYLYTRLQESQFNDLQRLVQAFEVYRRHMVLRLSSEKVLKGIGDPQGKELLTLTFLHGTRALQETRHTQFTFVPTGWCRQLGKVPFMGEMGIGSSLFGINHSRLSGTYLERSNIAKEYANGFALNIQIEEHRLASLGRMKIEDPNSLVKFSNALGGFETAILRFALWNQKQFVEKHQAQLLDTVKRLQVELRQLEEKRPAELYNWQDNGYSESHAHAKHSLELLKQFLSNPLPKPLNLEQKQAIEQAFPTVIASDTLLPSPATLDDYTGEQLVEGAAKLGRDIQSLFVAPQDRVRAEKFLSDNGLKDKVKVYPFEVLDQTRELHVRAGPYIKDIFSKKKLARLS